MKKISGIRWLIIVRTISLLGVLVNIIFLWAMSGSMEKAGLVGNFIPGLSLSVFALIVSCLLIGVRKNMIMPIPRSKRKRRNRQTDYRPATSWEMR